MWKCRKSYDQTKARATTWKVRQEENMLQHRSNAKITQSERETKIRRQEIRIKWEHNWEIIVDRSGFGRNIRTYLSIIVQHHAIFNRSSRTKTRVHGAYINWNFFLFVSHTIPHSICTIYIELGLLMDALNQHKWPFSRNNRTFGKWRHTQMRKQGKRDGERQKERASKRERERGGRGGEKAC